MICVAFVWRTCAAVSEWGSNERIAIQSMHMRHMLWSGVGVSCLRWQMLHVCMMNNRGHPWNMAHQIVRVATMAHAPFVSAGTPRYTSSTCSVGVPVQVWDRRSSKQPMLSYGRVDDNS
eukprot:4476091-Amphidinium_carterae.1